MTAIRLNDTWEARLLRLATGDGKRRTLTGLLVAAILFDQAPSKPPRIVSPTAIIDEDGRTWVGFQDYTGKVDLRDIGHIQEVRDDLRALADAAYLTDEQREELFSAFRKWIAEDHRALTEPPTS